MFEPTARNVENFLATVASRKSQSSMIFSSGSLIVVSTCMFAPNFDHDIAVFNDGGIGFIDHVRIGDAGAGAQVETKKVPRANEFEALLRDAPVTQRTGSMRAGVLH